MLAKLKVKNFIRHKQFEHEDLQKILPCLNGIFFRLSTPKIGIKMRTSIDQTCINTIRILAADMVQKANSGHPGAPMGCSPLAHVLFSRHFRACGKHPSWLNRDRFVLSNGHACALQYIFLHFLGYSMTMDDLKDFRQLDSKTAGHPENILTDGIEVTTGPLGQGIANAVGLALAEVNLAANFNRPDFCLIDNFTFVLCGDGCLQEGISAEALSLAGHLKLGRLIVIYDDNKVTIDGETDLSFTEDVSKRFEAYGFHVEEVEDGDNSIESFHHAIERAKSNLQQPSLIRVKTTIGFGSKYQGTEKVHGAPLGLEEVCAVKEKLGFNPNASFFVSPEVYSFYQSVNRENESKYSQWHELFIKYKQQYPDLAGELERRMRQELNYDSLLSLLPKFTSKDPEMATRKCSELVLNAIGNQLTELIGGSADLTSSNLTKWKGSVDFQASTPNGRYIRYGVREHAMAAISNGIFAYGCFIPFCATFLNFIGYAQGAVRLSALSRFQVIYIMTHDSIGLGEDGPTHQPIEILSLLRATPNMLVFRPADGNEVSGAYFCALKANSSPSVICLSRQNLPQLEHSSRESVSYGAYVVKRFDQNSNASKRLVFVATGSEVSICIEAAKLLEQDSAFNVQVISFPCFELFENQSNDYRMSVFPQGLLIISVEASATFGWSRYSHFHVGLDTFGASGPYKAVYEKFGITAPDLKTRAVQLMHHFATNEVPILPLHFENLVKN